MNSIKDFFIYDEASSGLLINAVSRGTRVKAGQPVHLCTDKDGYKFFISRGVRYSAHRVIWEIHNGPIPAAMEIDHINKNKKDNRIINLRLASRAQNCWNQRKRCTSNPLLPKGITEKKPGYYRASVMANGKRIRKNSSDLEFLKGWLTAQRQEMHSEFRSA